MYIAWNTERQLFLVWYWYIVCLGPGMESVTEAKASKPCKIQS